MTTIQPARVAALGALCAASVTGCGGSFLDDLDLSTFKAAPLIDELDLGALKPAAPQTYIELRHESYSGSVEVVSSIGTKCGDATNQPACITELDALRSSTGFWREGLFHWHTLAVNAGDANSLIDGPPGMSPLFGTIDAPEEALFLAAGVYYWSKSAVENGGYRAVPDGYELLVLHGPCTLDRMWLWVHVNGAVETLESEQIDWSPEVAPPQGCDAE
jgi:hypothetical protein